MTLTEIETNRCRRWNHAGLFVALFVAAAIQSFVVVRSPLVAKDGLMFIRVARSLRDDFRLTIVLEDQHPGYPAMILAASWLVEHARLPVAVDPMLTGARLATGASGLACIALIWLITRRLFEAPIANVAALLTATLPLFRQNAADALSDSPHLMMYLLSAWAASEGLVRERPRWFVLSGLASGLAFWIRPEGLSAAIVVGVMLLGYLIFARRHLRPSIAAGSLMALAVSTLMVVAPYVAMSGKLTSKKNPFLQPPQVATSLMNGAAPSGAAVSTPTTPSVSSTGVTPVTIATSATPSSSGISATPALATSVVPYELAGAGNPLRHGDEVGHIDSLRGRLAAAVVEFVEESLQAFAYILLITLAVGHLAPRRPRPLTRPFLLLWGLAGCHIALLGILYWTAQYMSHRHLMPLVAVSMPCVASGAVHLARRLGEWLQPRRSARWALPAVVTVLVLAIIPRSLRPLHEVYEPVVEASLWIKAHAVPGDRIVATSQYARVYTSLPGPLIGMEAPDLETAVAKAADRGHWPYLLLEVDPERFDPRQVMHLGGDYREVLRLPTYSRGRLRNDVLVYEPTNQTKSGLTARAENSTERSAR